MKIINYILLIYKCFAIVPKKLPLNIASNKFPWSYSELLENIKKKNIDSITIFQKNGEYGTFSLDSNHESGLLSPENIHTTTIYPNLINSLTETLEKKHIFFDIYNVPDNFNIVNFIFSPFGFIGLYLLFIFFNNMRMNSFSDMPNNNNPFNPLGRLTQNIDVNSDEINTRFNDVAGCDEAKYELTEVVDFLKNGEKYENAGAKIPRGVLLEGEPGTGKTLMTRAVAGEANVPFISVSGSEFIEVFVGVGASRVRKLFDKARESAPCVIFIDEIDAIGRQRGAGINTGNDEREQTLNQILTNMDGFKPADGIIVIAATNRADILDSALLRPGRFDRKVRVPLPDEDGRKAIAKVHFRNKNITSDVDLNEVSSLTSGFSGADIANLANEAAIMSVRDNSTMISRDNIITAFEKITIGLPSKVEKRSNEILELVSYHETGHALLASIFSDFFNVRSVTIRANQNGAGGYTLFTPKDFYNNYPTKSFILANLVVALGGRAAEALFFNNKKNYNNIFSEIENLSITTGASNDLQQANSIAKRYVSKYGLGENIGIYDSSNPGGNPFVGRSLGTDGNGPSDNTLSLIDNEVTSLVNYAYEKALDLLHKNNETFYKIANNLLENNTISGQNIINIM